MKAALTPAIQPEINSVLPSESSSYWLKILLEILLVENNTATIGALLAIGDQTPLKSPLIPSFLIILRKLWDKELLLFDICILTLIVSKGWPT